MGIRNRTRWFRRDVARKLFNIPKKADPAMVAQCEHLLTFDSAQRVAIDDPHAVLIFGLAVSHKPERVLEVGVGSGFLTQTLLNAVQYNQRGTLTCVDNWFDTGGEEPGFFEELLGRFPTIDLVGNPQRQQSNLNNSLKSLPVRLS